MFTDIVILAGGYGERLWPASSLKKPKQFMSLEGGVSFLQSSINRALTLVDQGKILVITRNDLLDTMISHCAEFAEQLDEQNKNKLQQSLVVIAEPCPKHTTSPVALAIRFLQKIDSSVNHSILVLTSDHVICPLANFVSDVGKAYEAAVQGNFVCFGISPTEPSTGYGYMKVGSPIKSLESSDIYEVNSFKEKPDLETAKKYLESGKYWWNSGMFAFTSELFLDELKKCEPKVYEAFLETAKGSKPVIEKSEGIMFVKQWPEMDESYKKTISISIDKAIAERTDKVCAVKATFDWEDIGSWDAFERLFSSHAGVTTEVESDNCFVYSDIPVALCGVDDVVVVIKNGSALVMKKGKSSLVRDAVHAMKEKGILE